ncbi:hypothetical protein LX64_04032 [Chitinophaga skermanii]|uniref:Uncharacterized protein n=1 Tax=Chitinophaga skermanii TaxID=331697 RepID=A0A327Q7H0_9BACT|nr:hypothetical protein LX64_04032 [Chitinophaga skermanii]
MAENGGHSTGIQGFNVAMTNDKIFYTCALYYDSQYFKAKCFAINSRQCSN